MKSFPPDAFTPSTGKLGQLIYENPDRGISPRLEFSIEIPFEPFELADEDEEISTALWLSGLRVEAKSWRDLSETSCEDSSLKAAEGSIRMFNAMNPVEVSKLEFGAAEGGTIDISMEVEMDFELDGDEEYGVVTQELSAKLEIDGLRIATSIDKRLKSDPAAIASEIGGAIDLSAYGELEKVPGGVMLPIKI